MTPGTALLHRSGFDSQSGCDSRVLSLVTTPEAFHVLAMLAELICTSNSSLLNLALMAMMLLI